MRSAMTAAVFLVFAGLGNSATLHVPSQYATIQDAINSASNGDTILVAPGTYCENIDFMGKAIVVTSSQGPEVTILDGGNPVNPDFGSVVTFSSGEGPDSLLDGLTITNGTGTADANGHRHGLGIFCADSSPSIENNHILKNANPVFGYGAGIYCVNASPLIKDNMITSNSVFTLGGGVFCKDASPLIMDNEIKHNSASWGAGIYCYSSFPGIMDNVIQSNFDTGICCEESSPAIVGNNISHNGGMYGGGIICWYWSSPEIVGNIISENMSFDHGGGIYCFYSSSPIIANSIITGNEAYGHWDSGGGGIYANYSCVPRIINTTISGNYTPWYGGGILCADAKITNSIIYGNYEEEITGDATITYSDVRAGYPGSGNIDADPLFVDASGNDFHIFYTSPCRDSGDNAAAGLPLVDFEGDARVVYGTVDMGADEFSTHLYTVGEYIPGGTVKLHFVGTPGTSPVGLCIGSGVLDPPIPSKWGDWYLQFPIVGPALLGSVPSPAGILVIRAEIPGSIPIPCSVPMQALIGDILTNLCAIEIK